MGSAQLASAQLYNIWGVNCTCNDGEFANEVTGECAPCTPGTFNVDGMRYDDSEFMTWDVNYWDGTQVNSPAPGVTAYCEGEGCEGWQYNDYFGGLSSGWCLVLFSETLGDNWGVNNIRAVLVITQDFIRDSGNCNSFLVRAHFDSG